MWWNISWPGTAAARPKRPVLCGDDRLLLLVLLADGHLQRRVRYFCFSRQSGQTLVTCLRFGVWFNMGCGFERLVIIVVPSPRIRPLTPGVFTSIRPWSNGAFSLVPFPCFSSFSSCSPSFCHYCDNGVKEAIPVRSEESRENFDE